MEQQPHSNTRKSALRFIVLLGIVSLFADFTYEGARAIIGPYLSLLGANAALVGIIVGIGQLIGYGVRALSGYFVDKTKIYWGVTILGYCINLGSVPLLALAGTWEMAAALILLERFGKAVRVPARDAMLSYATKQTGHGWGFGIHEALDQIGALLGPLTLAIFLYYQESYRFSFAMLAIPAFLSILTLVLTRVSYPAPQQMEVKQENLQTKGFSKTYWIYILGIGLVALGFSDFALISYHFQKAATLSPMWIPFFYAIAMGVDGLAALGMGKLFDLRGISILSYVTAITALFAPLAFLGGFYSALFGIILWGISLGVQESIMRAIVAHLVPPERRGSAYGIMHFAFGLFWALGSIVMGTLYDYSPIYLVLFSLLAQWAAIPFFLWVAPRLKMQ